MDGIEGTLRGVVNVRWGGGGGGRGGGRESADARLLLVVDVSVECVGPGEGIEVVDKPRGGKRKKKRVQDRLVVAIKQTIKGIKSTHRR